MRRIFSGLRSKHRTSKSPAPSAQSREITPPPYAETLPAKGPDESHVPAHIDEIRRQIWNDAYDKVKEDEPRLVDAYEKILSVMLKAGDAPPSGDQKTANDIKQDADARQIQMKALIEEGIERTKKQVDIKGGIDDVVRPIQNVKDFVSVVVRAEPTAAVAWAGLCACMEIMSNPVSEPGKNRDGVAYVCERVAWYWELALLLVDPVKVDGSVTKLQSLVKCRITALYKKLLLYQMQSVCLYSRHWASVILRDVFKLDDWQSKVDSIKEMEESIRKDVNQHDSEVLKSQLRTIDDKLAHLRKDVQAVELAVQQQTQDIRQTHRSEKDQECLRALHVVNPDTHKKELEKTKGGLLKGSYGWVLSHDGFCKFRNDPQSRLLWIKGDPGKGKTMLLCGIIDELNQEPSHTMSYFFCQATQDRCRSATSVLRSLLWLLCTKQPNLTSYVRARYDMEGKTLFEGFNTMTSLGEILAEMLRDPSLQDVIFVIDALDECLDDRESLISLVTQFSNSTNAKWVVSSRNWPVIEEQFQDAEDIRVALELNAQSVSQAVEVFIHHKVDQLARKKRYDAGVKKAVFDALSLKANDTFLWVALVCEELARPGVKTRDAMSKLASMPQGLNELYERMLKQIFALDDHGVHRHILATACVAYRPLALGELSALVTEVDGFGREELKEAIEECGSFLAIQDGVVYFVHQSAKDFLLKAAARVFPSGIPDQHQLVFRRSLDALTALGRNMYHLHPPGILIGEVARPGSDPLRDLGYFCLHWVDHLEQIGEVRTASEDEAVLKFISKRLLYWLEALSLSSKVSEGVAAVGKLRELMRETATEGLEDLTEDVRRFVLYHAHVIEIAPLQVYVSALVFSPTNSLVRKLFEKEEPDWITLKPRVDADWDSCIQTLEAHRGPVWFVALSADGKRLASGSDDERVKVWDLASSQCIRTFKTGYDIGCVCFSADSKMVASGGDSQTISLWDPDSGLCVEKLPGAEQEHEAGFTTSIAFSADGRFMASSDSDGNVWLLDLATKSTKHIVSDESCEVIGGSSKIAFSDDSRLLAGGSREATPEVWDTATGSSVWKLTSHDEKVASVAFAGDLLAIGFKQTAERCPGVEMWDVVKGICVWTHEDPNTVFLLAALGHGRQVAFGSGLHDFSIWDGDDSNEAPLRTLDHSGMAWSLASCPKSRLLASGSNDGTVKVWDLTLAFSLPPAKGHAGSPARLRRLGCQRIASLQGVGKMKIWDTSNDTYTHRDVDHFPFTSSPDGRFLVSIARDSILLQVELWDMIKGERIAMMENTKVRSHSASVSLNVERLALCLNDGTVGIWDMAMQRETHRIPRDAIAVALSCDSDDVAIWSPSPSGPVVDIWDTSRGTCIRALERQEETIFQPIESHPPTVPLALSRRSQRVVAAEGGVGGAPNAYQICVWHLSTGALLYNFTGDGHVSSLTFSADGRHLAAEGFDGGGDSWVKVWDAETGEGMQTMEFGRVVRVVGFDPTDSSRLQTTEGVFHLDKTREVNAELEAPMLGGILCGYGVVNDREGGVWILKGTERLLWLPAEVRSYQAVVEGSMVAVPSSKGEEGFCFIKFAWEEEDIPPRAAEETEVGTL